MTQEELKRCPFCGARGALVDVTWEYELWDANKKSGRKWWCVDCLFWDEIPSNTVTPEYHKCKLLGIQMVAHDYCSRGRREP